MNGPANVHPARTATIGPANKARDVPGGLTIHPNPELTESKVDAASVYQKYFTPNTAECAVYGRYTYPITSELG